MKQFLMVLVLVVLALPVMAAVPIKDGVLQTDLNGAGKKITNTAAIVFADGSVQVTAGTGVATNVTGVLTNNTTGNAATSTAVIGGQAATIASALQANQTITVSGDYSATGSTTLSLSGPRTAAWTNAVGFIMTNGAPANGYVLTSTNNGRGFFWAQPTGGGGAGATNAILNLNSAGTNIFIYTFTSTGTSTFGTNGSAAITVSGHYISTPGTNAATGPNFVAGDESNFVLQDVAGQSAQNSIGGGTANVIRNSYASVIGGGSQNSIINQSNVFLNSLENDFIGEGQMNAIVNSSSDFIGGGLNNSIWGRFDSYNGAPQYNVIGGGANNLITNSAYANIIGGFSNVVWSVTNSTGIGSNIRLTNNNSLVMSDGSRSLTTVTNNTAVLNYTNGIGLGTNNPAGYTVNVGGSINAQQILVQGSPLSPVVISVASISNVVVTFAGSTYYLAVPTQAFLTNGLTGTNGNFTGTFTGGASNLTSLSAAQLTGLVPLATLSTNVVTNITAGASSTNLMGTDPTGKEVAVPIASLGGGGGTTPNVLTTNAAGNQIVSGPMTFAGVVQLTNASNTISGNGSGLSLSKTNIASAGGAINGQSNVFFNANFVITNLTIANGVNGGLGAFSIIDGYNGSNNTVFTMTMYGDHNTYWSADPQYYGAFGANFNASQASPIAGKSGFPQYIFNRHIVGMGSGDDRSGGGVMTTFGTNGEYGSIIELYPLKNTHAAANSGQLFQHAVRFDGSGGTWLGNIPASYHTAFYEAQAYLRITTGGLSDYPALYLDSEGLSTTAVPGAIERASGSLYWTDDGSQRWNILTANSLVAGSGVTLTTNANQITISAAGDGSGLTNLQSTNLLNDITAIAVTTTNVTVPVFSFAVATYIMTNTACLVNFSSTLAAGTYFQGVLWVSNSCTTATNFTINAPQAGYYGLSQRTATNLVSVPVGTQFPLSYSGIIGKWTNWFN